MKVLIRKPGGSCSPAITVLLILLLSVRTLGGQEPTSAPGQADLKWVVEQGRLEHFTIDASSIGFGPQAESPAWLRTEREYQDFELDFEYKIGIWGSLNVLIHAPLHGNPTWSGFNLRLNSDEGGLDALSTGAVFPVVRALAKAGFGPDKWNGCRIRMEWPRLQVWVNNTLVQDCDFSQYEELRFRLKQGYLGFKSERDGTVLRNVHLRELPRGFQWTQLIEKRMLASWREYGKAKWEILSPDEILKSSGGESYLVSPDKFRDFEFQTYVRYQERANGGIYFRWSAPTKTGRGYEIQIYSAGGDERYPTGSLYNLVRANRPRVRPEEWLLLQVTMQDRRCVVRVNGETLVDYRELSNENPGNIALQAHQSNHWIEYRDMRIRSLD